MSDPVETGRCTGDRATEVLTLLYPSSASVTPSPAPARADGGPVRDV